MRLSRHARHNMRLYGIRPKEIEQTVQNPERTEREGRYHIAYKEFSGRFRQKPLKVVYVIEDDIVVVSVYPLRKAYWG